MDKKKTNVKSILQNERMSGGLMFVLFLIFFGTLVVMIRTAPTKDKNGPLPSGSPSSSTGELDNGDQSQEGKFDFVDLQGYRYIYTFEMGDQKEMITGKKYGDKEKFTILTGDKSIEGGRLKDQYLTKDNGQYVFSAPPSQNLGYTTSEFLNGLYRFTLSYEEKKTSTIYTVDPLDVIDLLDSDIQYDPFGTYKEDEMEIYEKEGKVTKVVLKLDHYMDLASKGTTKSLKITLEYDEIGTLEDFELN